MTLSSAALQKLNGRGEMVHYNVISLFKIWVGYSGADFANSELIRLSVNRNPFPGFSVGLEAVNDKDYSQVQITV